MEVPDKEEYLEQLTNFLESAKSKVRSVLDKLGWDEEKTFQGLKTEEEIKDEGNATETITQTEAQELPLGESKSFPGPLYNELLSTLTESGKMEAREKTELEKLAEVRDAKRRRATYRNKVHTKNKSQTQVLREVIEQQMTMITGCTEEKAAVSRPVEAEKPDLKEYRPSGSRESNPHLEWKRAIKLEEKKDTGKSESRRSSRERERRSFDDSRKDRRYDERDSRDYRRDSYRESRKDETWRRGDYDRTKYSDSSRYKDDHSKLIPESRRRPDTYDSKRRELYTESSKRDNTHDPKCNEVKTENRKRSDTHDTKRRRTEEDQESSRSHNETREKKHGKKRKKDRKKKKKRRNRSITRARESSSSSSND